MSGTIPIVFCIDCESDAREISAGTQPDWLGLEELVPTMREWRKVFAAASGRPVRFVWTVRADPGIEHVYGHAAWAFDHYRDVWTMLADEGDEIGLHVHPWRWDEPSGRWVADYADDRWTAECIRIAHSAATKVHSLPIRSFRYGDRIMSNTVMRTLADLGIAYDLTLEPGQPQCRAMKHGEHSVGRIPDQRGLRRKPYRPSRLNFRRRGWLTRSNLWFVPITTGQTLGHVHGLADDVPPCQTLLLGAPFEAVRPVIEAALHDRNRPYLGAVCRTDVRLDPYNREQFDKTLEFLASHPMRSRFAFETPDAIVRLAG